MVRWCWVNFQCQGILLSRIVVGQVPTALAVGAGWGFVDIFFLSHREHFASIRREYPILIDGLIRECTCSNQASFYKKII